MTHEIKPNPFVLRQTAMRATQNHGYLRVYFIMQDMHSSLQEEREFNDYK